MNWMENTFYPVRLRVRYAETDQMGVVHHSTYPIWFEAARTELSRVNGLPYSDWERQGVFLPLAELHCRYLRPAYYDNEVIIWVRVSELGSRRVVFQYRAESSEGQILAEGETRHVAVDKVTGRPIVIPEQLRDSMRRPPPVK